MIEVKDIVVDVEATLGSPLWLVDKRPLFEYRDGVRGNQTGWTFSVVAPSRRMKKLNVKIEDLTQDVEIGNDIVEVEFKNLAIKLYRTKDGCGISAAAEAIKAVPPKSAGGQGNGHH